MNKSTVSVIVPTFGDFDTWNKIAAEASASASWSVRKPGKVIRTHDSTLARARNLGAIEANTDWIIFLDADDSLRRYYCNHMLEALASVGPGKWIFRPNTIAVVDGEEEGVPQMIPRSDLFESNCIVIGAMVRREDVLSLGGFSELPRLEDWDLFLRLYIDGAEIVDVPKAVYRVHYGNNTRNIGDDLHGQIAAQIRSKYAASRSLYSDQG